VRPLLPFTREETRAYCDQEGLWYHDDPANIDESFARVRIRTRVMPELRLVNSAAEEALARLAAIAGEEDRFLDGMAAAALEQTELALNGDLRFLTEDAEAAFDRQHLAHLPPVLLKRALRLAARALGASLDAEQTIGIVRGLAENDTGSFTAEGGHVAIEWDEQKVHVRELRPSEPFRFPLTVPGETLSEEFGWQFTAFSTDQAGPQDQPRASFEAWIDAERLEGPPYFRNAKPGDEMRPLGFGRRRKLADLLSEARLTPAARARLPVVCDLIGPVWAPGICLDERIRSSKDTRRALILRFGRLPSPSDHNGGNGVEAGDVP
jgi:tRNA(Ile)-lysidine synthase